VPGLRVLTGRVKDRPVGRVTDLRPGSGWSPGAGSGDWFTAPQEAPDPAGEPLGRAGAVL
jgi:hypothetical protein